MRSSRSRALAAPSSPPENPADECRFGWRETRSGSPGRPEPVPPDGSAFVDAEVRRSIAAGAHRQQRAAEGGVPEALLLLEKRDGLARRSDFVLGRSQLEAGARARSTIESSSEAFCVDIHCSIREKRHARSRPVLVARRSGLRPRAMAAPPRALRKSALSACGAPWGCCFHCRCLQADRSRASDSVVLSSAQGGCLYSDAVIPVAFAKEE